MRILDAYGLPDLTMRRLAAALDVQPSALYWHFPNKQSLLAELSDRIVAQARPGSPHADWRERVRYEASALRAALLAHRDGAEVVTSTFAFGMGSAVAEDRLSAAVAGGGFDEDVVRPATAALLHFVLGHVLHEQQRAQYDRLGLRADDGDAFSSHAASHAAFAFGVDLLVGGLQLRVER